MLAEIITIGDEILIGQIVDTNSAFLSKNLNAIGVHVYQITSIQDDEQHILEALKAAKKRVDLVVITGGLGPTKDDITKQTFCEFFEDTLVENSAVLENINRLFSKYFKRKPTKQNIEQALVPSKAIILHNEHGTAPGMWVEEDNVVFVSMPGVPYEMKQLFQNEVIPRIVKRFDRPFIYHKTLLTYGLGESSIANRIEAWENFLPKEIKLAYLPSLGKVRLRLSSKGKDEQVLKAKVDKQMDLLEKQLEDIAVGYEHENSIEERIGMLLVARNQTLSLAESCTGGAIATSFTANAGASDYFKGSIVPYETMKKVTILGISEQLIKDFTVVSEQVAEAMAIQVKELFGSDYAVATTGIAGPSKGDADDEIGTVFIAIASPSGVITQKFSFGTPRERVIQKATNKALEMLHKEILKN